MCGLIWGMKWIHACQVLRVVSDTEYLIVFTEFLQEMLRPEGNTRE